MSNVEEGGPIIIGDMQLGSRWRAVFNPMALLMSRRYGVGTKRADATRLQRVGTTGTMVPSSLK